MAQVELCEGANVAKVWRQLLNDVVAEVQFDEFATIGAVVVPGSVLLLCLLLLKTLGEFLE